MNRDSEQVNAPAAPCLVCGGRLSIRSARGRKSGKPFIMLVCPEDARHFRAFITDQRYVAGVVAKLEGSASRENTP